MISAKAGLLIRTPAVIPIIVVNANPLNRPAPAQYRGSNETKAVAYADITIKIARFIFSRKEPSLPRLASSKMTICWSTPVPMVARIPAMEGKSKFHLITEATPKIITISEKEVNNTARDSLFFYIL